MGGEDSEDTQRVRHQERLLQLFRSSKETKKIKTSETEIIAHEYESRNNSAWKRVS